MTPMLRAAPAALLLLLTAGCSKAPGDAPPPASTTEATTENMAGTAAPAALPPQPPGDDPATFAPLRSVAVKDAIHRALTTGQTQRWQDGKLSGYAVPSLTPGANGCRAVRYTVDQRSAGAYESINACDASR